MTDANPTSKNPDTGVWRCGPSCEQSDALVEVLHRLRLSGRLDTDALAAREQMKPVDVEQLLVGARSDGLVKHRLGPHSGWTLTDQGRRMGEKLLQHQLDCGQPLSPAPDLSAGSTPRAAIGAAYESFVPLNAEILSLCTRWQVKQIEPVVLNDHSDKAYDRQVITDLAAIHERAGLVWRMLTSAQRRFAQYEPRFDHALGRLQAGHVDWLTKPTIDSYHTIWFELHEDFLATLGLDRASEPSQVQT